MQSNDTNDLFAKNDGGLDRLRHHLRARKTVIWLLVCLMLMLNGVPGKAQGNYPEPKDGDIHNFAGVLTSEDTASQEQMLPN